MDWRTIRNQGFKVVDGCKYDLTHLGDARYHFTIEATRSHPELSLELLVQYSSHCVSWGPSEGTDIDFGEHGEDRRITDEKGVHRCFSERRYYLSRHLPHVFRTLLHRKCIFTGRENWLTIEVLDDNGAREEYEVYFSLSRQSSTLLRAYVESAYVRDAGSLRTRPAHVKRKDKMGAKVLLAKKIRGQPIRRPPRR